MTIRKSKEKPKIVSHRELCEIGAKWLKNIKNHYFRSQYVLIEFCSTCGESPDIFGLRGNHNILIEVKVSHSDFIVDLKKEHRKEGQGIGLTRYYLCPTDLIKVNELPNKWGLLYYNDNEKIAIIKKSEAFLERDFQQELIVMQSVIRRLAGKPQVLDFRIKK